MNIKKLVVSAAAAGAIFAATTPAFAAVNLGALNGNTLQTNDAHVTNNVHASSNTGKNVNAGAIALQSSHTGDATTVVGVGNSVNGNSSSCGCTGVNVGLGNGNTVQTNDAHVRNNVHASSNTGGNANFALLGAQNSNTGDAQTGVVVENVVNSNVN